MGVKANTRLVEIDDALLDHIAAGITSDCGGEKENGKPDWAGGPCRRTELPPGLAKKEDCN